MGDLHFSQGDGEISFCGAIEMAGVITLKLSVMKNGMKDLDMKSPLFLPGPVEPHYGPGRYLTFEGFSVDEKGVQVSVLRVIYSFLLLVSWVGCRTCLGRLHPRTSDVDVRGEMLTPPRSIALHGCNSRLQTGYVEGD